MLDKILYVPGKSDKPLLLLQSLLSPFLQIGTTIDSFHSPAITPYSKYKTKVYVSYSELFYILP